MKNQEKYKLGQVEYKSIGLDYNGCINLIKEAINNSVDESAKGYDYTRFLKKLRFWIETDGVWSPVLWVEKEIVAAFASKINRSNTTAVDVNKCATCWNDALSGTSALFIMSGLFNDEQEQQVITSPSFNHKKKKK